ncbi:nicotinate-nucleotide adenylyltransferase [Bartonella sp. TP]|uniref:nicotinate-nucleotide adenylyltransferase n=1 Tax=Bartonella sp. TP TaxID=3057550 RepID=UPI0025AFCCB9|nr:nicotinate-nucleotide adenylyltransferase [Bartonella sp. TP]WJW80252.1 nicotinate-nucleotide adenylyltransferase [Bartonella sp. TP]
MAYISLDMLPQVKAGQKIGLFGGTFNPPHEGHVLVANTALRCLGLDRLWWMVTPGNPLKANVHLPSIKHRVAASALLLKSFECIDITAFEAALASKNSFETLRYLSTQESLHGVNFVWIIGGDSLANFHLWYRWQDLAAMLPIAVVWRPTALGVELNSVFAKYYKKARIAEQDAEQLAFKLPPAWCYLRGELSNQSSTNLRMR